MDGVVPVEEIGEAPLGQSDPASRPEQAPKFVETAIPVGRVADGFKRVGSIETVVGERYVQVVGQQEIAGSLKPRSACRPPASRDLVCVVVQPRDAGAGGLRDVDRGTPDSASDVGDLRARSEIQDLGYASLLAALRGVEAFSGSSWREVEGLPPTVLVEPGDDIVESTYHPGLIAQDAITVSSPNAEFLECEKVVERLPQAAAAVRLDETVTASFFGPVILTPGRFGRGGQFIPPWSTISSG